jgi:ABC-type transport system involved in multi-copper enzyme maturation permease subunit
MLWYKAWLETRSRFLLSFFAIIAICSYLILHGDHVNAALQPQTWYYFVLQNAHAKLAMLWIVAVSLLSMGGLVRETAVGASDFTLALPVSRARLMWARIGIGILQAMSLALVPWLAMFLLACATGKANSVENAALHLLLLAGGGSVFVAWGLFVSSLISGEYTAPAVCLGVVLLVSIVLGDPPLNAWSPFSLVTGETYLNRHTGMLAGNLPWGRLGLTVLTAVALLGAAVKAVQRRDF